MAECIFCNIAAGRLKAQVVYEDQRVLAFRDVNPQAPVHILIIPRQHVERVSAVSEADRGLFGDIHRAAQIIAEKEGVVGRGFRLTVNEGSDAGQTVHHLHYHLLAGRKLGWPPG